MGKLADLIQGNDLWKRDFTVVRKSEPGTPDTVYDPAIRVVTGREYDLARVNATIYTEALDKRKSLGSTRAELVEDARIVEILAMALMDPQSTPNVPEPWASPEEIRARLRPEEIAAYWKAYEDFANDQGPIVWRMSEAEYNAVIAEIDQEASADPLLLFASSTRKSFIVSMARELVSLRTLVSSLSLDYSPTSTALDANAGLGQSTPSPPMKPQLFVNGEPAGEASDEASGANGTAEDDVS